MLGWITELKPSLTDNHQPVHYSFVFGSLYCEQYNSTRDLTFWKSEVVFRYLHGFAHRHFCAQLLLGRRPQNPTKTTRALLDRTANEPPRELTSVFVAFSCFDVRTDGSVNGLVRRGQPCAIGESTTTGVYTLLFVVRRPTRRDNEPDRTSGRRPQRVIPVGEQRNTDVNGDARTAHRVLTVAVVSLKIFQMIYTKRKTGIPNCVFIYFYLGPFSLPSVGIIIIKQQCPAVC